MQPPTIRPGQRKPYVKGTQAQTNERIGYVVRMLAARKTKAKIHRAIREKFNVEWRQTDRYIELVSRAQRASDT